MAVKILFKRSGAANWTSANPILDAGEPGFETNTGRFKIGDGVTPWNSLQYIFDGVNTINIGTVTTGAPGSSASVTNSGDTSNAVFDFVIPQGPAGVDGVDGVNGVDGVDGNTVLAGSVDPTTEGVDGDFYINLTTNTFFGPKTAGAWGLGFSLVGPQGTPGVDGVDGVNGADGIDGNTILSGTVAPTTEGVDGDFYIDTTTYTIYGPKAGGVWGSGTLLGGGTGAGDVVGPAGSTANAIALFDGTTGKLLQNSTVTIDPVGIITLPAGGDIRDSLGTSVLSASTLDNLSDVTIVSPSNGQVLKFNGSEWVNGTDNNVISDIDQIGNVSITGASIGQVLKFDGTNWTNAQDDAGTGAVPMGGTAGQFLTKIDAVDYNTTWTTVNVPAALTDLGITDGTSGQVLTTDGAGNFIFASVALGLEGLNNVSLTTPANGEVLTFNGTAWVNSAPTAGSTPALDDITNVAAPTPSANQVLKFDGTNWVNGSVHIDELSGVNTSGVFTGQVLKYNGSQWAPAADNVFPSRTSPSGTTASIADGVTGNVEITGFKSYALMKLNTSAASWVRLYTSNAARAADSGRAQGVDPAPGSGVLAEVITTGAGTVIFSPAVLGFNDEGPVTDNIACAVTNLSGSTTTITVTLTLLQLEF